MTSKFVLLICAMMLGFQSQVCLAQRDEMPFQIDESELPKPGAEEIAIRKVLAKRANINLPDKSLKDIASAIAEQFEISCKVDERALDDEGLTGDLKIDWVQKNASIGKSLYAALTRHDLDFAIKGGALFLTTMVEAESIMQTQVYDVSDILVSGKPQRVEVIRRGIITSSFDYQQLIELLESTCAPDSWEYVGGPGSTRAVELNGKQLLLISQTEGIQMEVSEMLSKLRKAAEIEKVAEPEAIDRKKPVQRIYPLKHDLKSTAEDYLTLLKDVIKQDWEADGNSIKAIANTLIVKQPPEVHDKILGMLVDLDVLLTPKPIIDDRNAPLGGFGGGGGGGFF